MIVLEGMFYGFVASCVLGAFAIIVFRNLVYNALGLLVCLVSVAGLYGLLHAEVLAATQLMIYAGGVLVLILFGIILTNRVAGKKWEVGSRHWVAGTLVTLGIGYLLIRAYRPADFGLNTPGPVADKQARQVGQLLMSDYVAPFEVSGIVLLVCLVGAALAASAYKKSI